MIDQRALTLRHAIDSKPRVPLGSFPTPLEEAPRLSARLGVRVLIKRDDLTGLALGGNKVRKLEFLIGDALEMGSDCVVTTGGSQSNHARLAAAACRRTGLGCYLVLERGIHPENQGNLLLDRLLGAHVCILGSNDLALSVLAMEQLSEELRAQGRKPYIIPRGGSVPVGATGYAAGMLELLPQIGATALTATHLYLGTGSKGTHSGIMAGIAATGSSLTVQGISVSWPRTEQETKVLALSNRTLEHLGLPPSVEAEQVRVDDRFAGPGYGYTTDETMEAIDIAARDEGLILDPVYTGKAMAGLIGHAREGRFGATDTVIFLHTGGAPALFAYHRETAAALEALPSE